MIMFKSKLLNYQRFRIWVNYDGIVSRENHPQMASMASYFQVRELSLSQILQGELQFGL